MVTKAYKYCDNSISTNKKAYHYSKYFGECFFDSWKSERQLLERGVTTVFKPPQPTFKFNNNDSEKVDTKVYLEGLYGESLKKTISPFASYWIERFLKKFETTHRLHVAYTYEFRAINVSEHKDLSLYIRFAEICVRVFEKTSDLRYLNVLIKIMDILVYENKNLGQGLLKRAAALSKRERTLVKFVAAKHRLNL